LPGFTPPGTAGTTCGEGTPMGPDPAKGLGLSPVMMPMGFRLGTSLLAAAVLGVRRVLDIGGAAGAENSDVVDVVM